MSKISILRYFIVVFSSVQIHNFFALIFFERPDICHQSREKNEMKSGEIFSTFEEWIMDGLFQLLTTK